MTDPKTPQIVGVIYSRADFQRALRMRNPPGFFELRLDALARHLDLVAEEIARVPAPLIVTARHPGEGGANNLSSRERQHLLLTFLGHAKYVDIELRAAGPLASVLQAARAKGVGIIISFHDFTGTPEARRLDRIASEAESLGADIFKIATRIETPSELDRLLSFFTRQRRTARIAAMGIGRLGRISRLEFARRGCPLNYAHLGRPQVAGQPSVRELRHVLP